MALGATTIRLGNKATVTIKRFAAGVDAYVNGILQTRAAPTTIGPYVCSVQPVGGQDLARLPEGFGTKDAWQIFSPVQLYGPNGDGSANGGAPANQGDLVLLSSATTGTAQYQVWHVDPWNAQAGYCKALVIRRTV